MWVTAVGGAVRSPYIQKIPGEPVNAYVIDVGLSPSLLCFTALLFLLQNRVEPFGVPLDDHINACPDRKVSDHKDAAEYQHRHRAPFEPPVEQIGGHIADIEHAVMDDFKSRLTEQDAKILQMRYDGSSLQEIANAVGFKTAGAVSKRILKIAGSYEDFVSDEYSEFLDKYCQ